MDDREKKIAQELIDSGLLEQSEYQDVKDRIQATAGRFHLAVLEMGYVTEENLAQTIAKVTNLPLVYLHKISDDPKALGLLSGEFCYQKTVYPCSLDEKSRTLWLAMADPFQEATLRLIRTICRLDRIIPMVGKPSEIHQHILDRYGEHIAQKVASASREIELQAEEEESFEITDIYGATTKHVDLKKSQPANEPGPSPAPTTPTATPAGKEALSSLSFEQRLERLDAIQARTTKVVRDQLNLLVRKGIISPDELHEILKP